MRMYNGDFEDISNISNYSFLQINSCGIQFPCNLELTTVRKHGRNDYHIVYIVEGACKVEYNNKTEVVKRGGFVLYPPNMPQKYTEYKDTKKLWLHFNGMIVPDLLKEAHLECGIHHTQHTTVIESALIQIVTEHNLQSYISTEKSILMALLYELGKQTNGTHGTGDRINDCIVSILSHYQSNTSLDEMASACNLSKSRFIHLFKQQTGQSPHAFRMSVRMDNCKSLLTSTDLDIAQISRMVGYDDALYLSRIFKKYTGFSPLHYRKISRQNNKLPE